MLHGGPPPAPPPEVHQTSASHWRGTSGWAVHPNEEQPLWGQAGREACTSREAASSRWEAAGGSWNWIQQLGLPPPVPSSTRTGGAMRCSGDKSLRAFIGASGAGLLFSATTSGHIDVCAPLGTLLVCEGPEGMRPMAVAALPCGLASAPELLPLAWQAAEALEAPGHPGWGILELNGGWRFESLEQLQAAIAATARAAQLASSLAAQPPCGAAGGCSVAHAPGCTYRKRCWADASADCRGQAVASSSGNAGLRQVPTPAESGCASSCGASSSCLASGSRGQEEVVTSGASPKRPCRSGRQRLASPCTPVPAPLLAASTPGPGPVAAAEAKAAAAACAHAVVDGAEGVSSTAPPALPAPPQLPQLPQFSDEELQLLQECLLASPRESCPPGGGSVSDACSCVGSGRC